MKWGFSLECERHEVLTKLYETANTYLSGDESPMPRPQDADMTNIADLQAKAEMSDAILYQVRTACATALGLIPTVTMPHHRVSIDLAGILNPAHDGTPNDSVSIVVAMSHGLNVAMPVTTNDEETQNG